MLKKYNSSGLLLKAFMELNHIKRVAPSTYEFKNKSITKIEYYKDYFLVEVDFANPIGRQKYFELEKG
jgi:hypothetical protein